MSDARNGESGRPGLLLLIHDLPAHARATLAQWFDVFEARPGDEWTHDLRRGGSRVRAVFVRGGQVAVTASDMDLLPGLRAIVCMGAGADRIEAAAAQARGIAITTGSGANNECVADHAMGLVIAIVRDFLGGDTAARGGRWQSGMRPLPQVSGKALGIAGLGQIGMALARRAAAFGMPIAYHSRRAVPDVPWPRHDDLQTLAAASDILVSTLPGGDATRHCVDRQVLGALGPRGYFVNVGRGSTVDTAALIEALEQGGIAGAALDVLDTEPEVPPRLAALRNVLITPHLAGRSPESTAATLERALASLEAVATAAR